MDSTLEKPQTLGRYELLTRLATGGMAEILLARETGIGGLERLVVIKRILPEYAEDPDFTEMFLREARIVARINDPNVVQVFELGEEAGDYFLAMEYIDGLTIAELIEAAIDRGKWFPIEASVAIVQQACKGLHQVHEVRNLDGELMGLIHRDVSHQNFMADGEGFVKLIDFGIAKSTRSQEEATHSGNLKGKYAYMSPEQCSRDDLDRRSDIFSLGVVAWELFAGDRLFNREDKLATIRAVTQEDVPPPSAVNSRVPEQLDRVVLRALRKDPGARFQTADEFREAILASARKVGIDSGTDPLGTFVQRTAGELLEDRRRERQKALKDSDATSTAATPDPSDGGDGGRDGWYRRPEVVSAMFLALSVMALALTGWLVFADEPSGADAAGRDDPITVAWPPIVGESVIREESAPIWNHVETELGRPVDLRYTSTYSSLSERLRAGQFTFGMVPPLLYVRAKDAEPGLEPLVVQEVDGQTSSKGVLLVRAHSEFETVAELEGERLCHPDRNSTTGYLLPRAFFREKGHDPDEFLGAPQWSGSHESALRDLLAGRCAAAATWAGSLKMAGELEFSKKKFREIAVTGRVPQSTLVASPTVSEALVERIRKILLAMEPPAVVGRSFIGDHMRITGFAPIRDSAYDELRSKVERADR